MKRLLLTIGLCAASGGCTLTDNFARTVVVEPLQYCEYIEVHTSHWRHCRMARDVWKKVQDKIRGKPFSSDYAHGFREGFTDYLDAGGTGHPPPLPPRHYWKNRYATPEGRQAVQDWFAGFSHGAAMAMQSGARQVVVVPASVPQSGIRPGVPGEYFSNVAPPQAMVMTGASSLMLPNELPDGGRSDTARPNAELLPDQMPDAEPRDEMLPNPNPAVIEFVPDTLPHAKLPNAAATNVSLPDAAPQTRLTSVRFLGHPAAGAQPVHQDSGPLAGGSRRRASHTPPDVRNADSTGGKW